MMANSFLFNCIFLLSLSNSESPLLTNSRYFVDDDNAAGEVGKGPSAIPIDVCFQSSSSGTKVYTKYTCGADGQSVTKQKYSDGSCTKTKGSETIYDRSSGDPHCGLHHFRCEGEDAFIVTGAYYETFSS